MQRLPNASELSQWIPVLSPFCPAFWYYTFSLGKMQGILEKRTVGNPLPFKKNRLRRNTEVCFLFHSECFCSKPLGHAGFWAVSGALPLTSSLLRPGGFSLFQAFVQLLCKSRSDALEYLHQNDQQDHRHHHGGILIPIIAVIDGNLS